MTETVIAVPDEAGEEAPELLSSADVAWKAGITFRQCDHWVRRGYLRPDGAALGSGRPRRWPRAEVDVARAMARLVRIGLTPAAAHRIARSGEIRTEAGPRIWLELGPAFSPQCERGDCGTCWPDEPSDCGHDCHEGETEARP